MRVNPIRTIIVCAAAGILVCAIGVRALAAPPADGAGTEAKAPSGPHDEFGRGVPRTAIEGFLRTIRKKDYERAAEYLDLRGVKKDDGWQGPALARALGLVLDRTLWIDLDTVSDRPEGHAEDGLPAYQDRVGRIELEGKRKVDILLQRVQRSDGVRVWKFASATVGRIPELYDHFGDGPLADYLPPLFFDVEFAGIQLWQWIGLLAAGVAALLAAHGLSVLGLGLVRWRSAATADALRSLAAGPLRLLLAMLLLSPVPGLLRLGLNTQVVFSAFEKSLVAVALAWGGLRLVDVLARRLADRLYGQGQIHAIALLPPATKTTKGLVVLLAAIVMAGSFGVNVTAVLAGLGVGGIAIALAAQKTIENLIGGISLFAVQPVRVGDFCRFGDKMGTVEEVGLYATRLRTLERSVVTVPNATFSNLELDNLTRRDKMWYHPTIGLRYETTPDQLRYVLVEIRKVLYAHPKVDSEPARVRFVGFGAYSLDLEIFAYVLATEPSEFLEVAEDLNLRIMDVVEQAGSGFAFPSQTTYVEQGGGLDAERARKAEAEVRQWRVQNELHLPRFPREAVRALADTLDYPPRGSSAARDAAAV
jgi:MscS family membrane protein